MEAFITKRACIACKHYVSLEDRVGVCKLFGSFIHARLNNALCAPSGKWFEPATFVKKDTELKK